MVGPLSRVGPVMVALPLLLLLLLLAVADRPADAWGDPVYTHIRLKVDATNMDRCGYGAHAEWARKENAYDCCNGVPQPNVRDGGGGTKKCLPGERLNAWANGNDTRPEGDGRRRQSQDYEDEEKNYDRSADWLMRRARAIGGGGGGRGSSRLAGGVTAARDEFPFMVHLMLLNYWDQYTDRFRYNYTAISGILIDRDIILTTASSLVPRLDEGELFVEAVTAGSSYYGTAPKREALRICYLRGFNKNTNKDYDMAIVVLKQPVKYNRDPEKGKLLGPVCVPLGVRHVDNTKCNLVAFGAKDEAGNVPSELQSMRVQRGCSPEKQIRPEWPCYKTVGAGATCAGDQGGAIVCYDSHCTDDEKTRAYLVGLVLPNEPGAKCKPTPGNEINRVLSLDDYKGYLMALVSYHQGVNDKLGDFVRCRWNGQKPSIFITPTMVPQPPPTTPRTDLRGLHDDPKNNDNDYYD